MKNSEEIKLAIADDAPFILEVVKHIVNQDENIDLVGEVQDGAEAVEFAQNNAVDVILMDMVMPKKNGIEATKEILAIKPEVKIIACSTLDESTMIMKAIDAGCCSYLTKPFRAKQLIEMIYDSMKEA